MNIGIVIYSLSGNTLSVAERIKERLTENGHIVSLEQIQISGKTPAQPGKFELTVIPDVSGYDALILGSPVQAFSLHPVMKAYLAKLPKLDGKKVALFVTKQLPVLWLGGTGSIKRMKAECEKQGAKVIGSDIVVWVPSKRDQTTAECVQNMGRYFYGN
jgi:flavodoxin